MVDLEGLNAALHIVRFQTYPLGNNEQETACHICNESRRASSHLVNQWMREHRIEHLRRALAAAEADLAALKAG